MPVTEEPTEESTTAKREESTTRREESTTASSSTAATTAPLVPEVITTYPSYIPQEIVTVPVIGNPNETMHYENLGVTPDYNIEDSVPAEIGNGMPLAFMLVLFTVVVIAGAVVFLTLSRKKEEEFE